MTLRLTKKSNLQTTTWSGGTTTQLFIFPEGADYQKRDFLFRISTATVESEESVFTSLPGFRRKLMVLEGSLLMKHKGQYEKQLNKFDSDEFEGRWETSAAGKATDFNLMLGNGAEGSMEAFILKEGESKKIPVGGQFFIYVFKGEIKIGEKQADQGDFAVIESTNEIILSAQENSEIIITHVSL